MSVRFDAAAVSRYYDRHTRRFVKHGQKGSDGALHRAVWAPGVSGRWQAFRHVEDRIAGLIADLPPAFGSSTVVDFGCGVGASLCYLAGRLPIVGAGVTLSPVQVGLARERIAAAGLEPRVRVLEGDYCDERLDLPRADLVYAIESFVHGPAPDDFFRASARILRPGGLLVLCDDVKRAASSTRAAATIDAFCRGWHVNTLLDAAAIRAAAERAGLEHEATVDLTPWLELNRPRDRVIRSLLAPLSWVAIRSTRFDYLQGGAALQTCLTRGWIGYDFMRFRKR